MSEDKNIPTNDALRKALIELPAQALFADLLLSMGDSSDTAVTIIHKLEQVAAAVQRNGSTDVSIDISVGLNAAGNGLDYTFRVKGSR